MIGIPSYNKAINNYKNKFKNNELSSKLLLKSNDSLIVRLDGKNLSKCFSISKNDMSYIIFYDAILFVIKEIRKYFSFIYAAYRFKDEISFLINKKKLESILKCIEQKNCYHYYQE